MKLLGNPNVYLEEQGLDAWRIRYLNGLVIGTMTREYSVFLCAKLYTIEVNGWSSEPMRHADACEWLSCAFDNDVRIEE